MIEVLKVKDWINYYRSEKLKILVLNAINERASKYESKDIKIEGSGDSWTVCIEPKIPATVISVNIYPTNGSLSS